MNKALEWHVVSFLAVLREDIFNIVDWNILIEILIYYHYDHKHLYFYCSLPFNKYFTFPLY